MKYTATWTDAKGQKHYEGTFRVLARLKGAVALGRIAIETDDGIIKESSIRIPLEGFEPTDKKVRNPQYWGDAIQVNIGEHPYPFVFEVVRARRYVIEIPEDNKELNEYLRDFLWDNKIDYEQDGIRVENVKDKKNKKDDKYAR